jgi:acyl-CoA dehydrogenase
MSHEREMLVEAVTGVIERFTTRSDDWDDTAPLTFDAQLWSALAEHGFTHVAVSQDAGGAGGELEDAAVVLRTAGRTATTAPIAETFVGAWLLDRASIPLPALRAVTVAPDARGLHLAPGPAGWSVGGLLPRVPWGHAAAVVVAVVDAPDGAGTVVVAVPPAICTAVLRTNVAGEPRDEMTVAGDIPAESVVAIVDGDGLLRRGALARAITMVGALERARDLTLAYLPQRRQFGRPLSAFQAMQQTAAELIGEVAAADAAVVAAIRAEALGPAPVAVAIAKIRVGHAAGTVAAIAHQLHGAIGVTDEYALHLFTRRLWAWRDEFGAEAWWSARLGRTVGADPRGIWDALTRHSA